jgi:hypothetical protein
MAPPQGLSPTLSEGLRDKIFDQGRERKVFLMFFYIQLHCCIRLAIVYLLACICIFVSFWRKGAKKEKEGRNFMFKLQWGSLCTFTCTLESSR